MQEEIGSSSTAEFETSRKSRGIPRWVVVTAALVLTVGVVGVLLYGYATTPGWVGVTDKKVWDYLDVFLVPVALALGVAWLTWEQNRRQREAEEAQQEHELEVEKQRAQDEALQAYLDQMSQLLTDKDRPLHNAQPGDSLSTVARARTLTVLTRLDGVHKGSVLRFLYESALIIKGYSTLSLKGADLSDVYRGEGDVTADVPVPPTPTLAPYEMRKRFWDELDLLNRAIVLGGRDLRYANLLKVNLSGAYLKAALLCGADLRRAYLSNADLSRAYLTGANLEGANLEGANLQMASLKEARLEGAVLEGANLQGARLEGAVLDGAYLRGANLQKAQLQKAHLKGTVLPEADLGEANLQEAHMEGLFLRGANLGGATGVTNEKLKQLAHSPDSLKGTTMPEGQKYEEWLKGKEGRGEPQS